MAETLITSDGVSIVEGASADGDGFWIPLAGLLEATGWELELEGACRDDVCVPLPSDASGWLRPGAFNFAALARQLGRPVVHDSGAHAWVVGESAQTRNMALASLEAPDFTLPDLDGQRHSLSDYRGRKVFLVSWASW